MDFILSDEEFATPAEAFAFAKGLLRAKDVLDVVYYTDPSSWPATKNGKYVVSFSEEK